MTKKATFADISRMLKSDPERFASALLGQEPTLRTGTGVRYFEHQSLVVNTSGPSQGRFYSFVDSDAKGDMIDLVRWHHGLADDKSGRHEALEIAKHHLGISNNRIDPAKLPPEKSAAERQKELEESIAKRIRTANWIWKQGSATQGREEGLAYLKNRGITCDIPSDTLRFRKISPAGLEKMDVARSDIPKTPVVSLIFAARNKEGQITAVQQILTTEGRKVQFDNPKRTNGHMPGASVMLGDPRKSTKMALVEGPETALSVFQSTGIPTQITLGSSNFTKVHVPENVEHLITVSDLEPTGVGLCSALKSAQYWKRNGIKHSGIAIPPRLNDGDYNDVHQKFGEALVQKGINGAYFPPEYDQDGTILITPDARAAFFAWAKTGIEVAAKVPPKDKETGKYRPFNIEGLIEDRHNRIFIVGNPAFEIRDDALRKMRPGIEIVQLHNDSREFRKLAKTEGGMKTALQAADMYAPDGMGENEPVFFSLRRSDADALKLEGHKSVAIRSSAIDRIDFSFMNGREAIVAPLGNGTDQDRKMTEKLEAAGAKTTRLTWQIFRGDDTMPRIIRRQIPGNFGAEDAMQEGWTGEALKDLVDISRANLRQMQSPMEQAPVKPKKRGEKVR
jgi:hypothetical protein